MPADAPILCGQCGYDVRGLPSVVCPECGGDLRVGGVTGIPSPRPWSTASWLLIYTAIVFALVWTPALIAVRAVSERLPHQWFDEYFARHTLLLPREHRSLAGAHGLAYQLRATGERYGPGNAEPPLPRDVTTGEIILIEPYSHKGGPPRRGARIRLGRDAGQAELIDANDQRLAGGVLDAALLRRLYETDKRRVGGLAEPQLSWLLDAAVVDITRQLDFVRNSRRRPGRVTDPDLDHGIFIYGVESWPSRGSRHHWAKRMLEGEIKASLAVTFGAWVLGLPFLVARRRHRRRALLHKPTVRDLALTSKP